MQGRALWRESRGMMAALSAGLCLRVLFVAAHPRFTGDTLVYGDLAHNMLAHRIYGLTEGHVRSTLIRLPGYPIFLALCFLLFGTGNYLAVVWVQVGVDLLSCVLLGRLAEWMWGERAGRWVLWLAMLCPFTANYAAAALTETLSLFCVAATLWALAGWVRALRAGHGAAGWAVGLGLGVAFATLLRPDGILLAGSALLAMLWFCATALGRAGPWRRGVGGAVLAGLILCAALGVWTGRNWVRFHVFQPLAPKYANDPDEPQPLGFARWYRTWAIGFNSTVDVYWTYDGSPLKLRDLPARAFDSPAQRRQTAALYARYNDVSAATPAFDAAFGKLAAERVRAHPVRYYVLLPLAKLADMWLRPRTELTKLPVEWWDVRAHPRRSAFEMSYAGLNLALLGMAVAGWVRWRRERWNGFAAVALAASGLVVLRSALLLTIDNSEPRYTLECYPVVLLLAGLWLARGRERFFHQVTGFDHGTDDPLATGGLPPGVTPMPANILPNVKKR